MTSAEKLAIQLLDGESPKAFLARKNIYSPNRDWTRTLVGPGGTGQYHRKNGWYFFLAKTDTDVWNAALYNKDGRLVSARLIGGTLNDQAEVLSKAKSWANGMMTDLPESESPKAFLKRRNFKRAVPKWPWPKGTRVRVWGFGNVPREWQGKKGTVVSTIDSDTDYLAKRVQVAFDDKPGFWTTLPKTHLVLDGYGLDFVNVPVAENESPKAFLKRRNITRINDFEKDSIKVPSYRSAVIQGQTFEADGRIYRKGYLYCVLVGGDIGDGTLGSEWIIPQGRIVHPVGWNKKTVDAPMEESESPKAFLKRKRLGSDEHTFRIKRDPSNPKYLMIPIPDQGAGSGYMNLFNTAMHPNGSADMHKRLRSIVLTRKGFVPGDIFTSEFGNFKVTDTMGVEKA